tara:strand:- start:620 stop:772 length:153 start_codon:yes stop_codon:yes gene_type:complete
LSAPADAFVRNYCGVVFVDWMRPLRSITQADLGSQINGEAKYIEARTEIR